MFLVRCQPVIAIELGNDIRVLITYPRRSALESQGLKRTKPHPPFAVQPKVDHLTGRHDEAFRVDGESGLPFGIRS
jgi:hypothetical protein